MDMKDRVEFVALTKEEIESMMRRQLWPGRLWRLRLWRKHTEKSRKN